MEVRTKGKLYPVIIFTLPGLTILVTPLAMIQTVLGLTKERSVSVYDITFSSVHKYLAPCRSTAMAPCDPADDEVNGSDRLTPAG